MKIYLDDLRQVPSGFDANPKTAKDCIELLKKGDVEFISFDHDLGPEEAGTGYEVACWIEEAAYNGEIPKLEWQIHSANPVGRVNITNAMKSAENFWSR